MTRNDKKRHEIGGLSFRQQVLITALCSSFSITDACKRAKISVSQCHRYMRQEKFIRALADAQEQIYQEGFELLKRACLPACRTLIKLMENSKSDFIKRACAVDIINYRKHEDIEKRLLVIESKIKGGQK